MYLSLYNIATLASENLHLNDQNETAWFMKKAQNAARRLRSWDGIKAKSACIEVNNDGCACVPCDFYRILAVCVLPNNYNPATCEPNQPTSTGNPSPVMMNPGGLLYYMDAPLLRSSGINCGNWCGTSRGFTLDGDILQIYGYRNCFINIGYMAYNMNDEGQMNIMDDWQEYLVNYICFEYCRAFPQLKPQYIMDSYERDYKSAFRGCRADAQLRNMKNNKAQLSLMMNSFVGGRAGLKILS